MQVNPLMDSRGLPAFASILPAHVEPAVRQTLAQQRRRLGQVQSAAAPTFECIEELERVHDTVNRVWSTVAHLNAVASTPEWRDAHNACLPLITEFGTEVAQNQAMYDLFAELRDGIDPEAETERQLLEHGLRDFRLAGVALPTEARARFRKVVKELAQYQARFEQNLMDAGDAFKRHEERDGAVVGLPDVVLKRGRELARAENRSGWILTLDPPTYTAIMTHARSEPLRRCFYEAWLTRASDQGPHAGRWDNGELIEKIVALRHESARLLGFDHFAELSLATKMAGSTGEVLDFLRDLAATGKPTAETELQELTEFAGRPLQPWDVPYYSEQLRQERFGLDQERLRPYFPLPRVLEGLGWVARTLFGLEIKPRKGVDTWHPDVDYHEVHAPDGSVLGGFFTDLFSRPGKRGGAWMDECRVRCRLQALRQNPVAYLVCNFNPPVGGNPALLTHDDVVTLFHEFGHTLHHLLTEVDYPSLSGINGVPWDAVELPSQFLENFAWLPDVLHRLSAHYRTGEALSRERVATLGAARPFQAGLSMVRQLEFALFDFCLHAEYDPAKGARAEDILARTRREVAVMDVPAFNRFANTFAHVFGGGYAAGYYSYKWAEVLAADAFSAFEAQGYFHRPTAARFRQCILATGGSRDAMDLFRRFRGRPPSLEPLLRQFGIHSGEQVKS